MRVIRAIALSLAILGVAAGTAAAAVSAPPAAHATAMHYHSGQDG